MKRLYNILLVVLGVNLFNACELGYSQQKMPFQTLTDIEGKSLQGDVLSTGNTFVLVASLTCGYCLRDIPYYNELADTYAGKGMRFVVLLEDKQENIDNFRSKTGRLFFNGHWFIVPDAERFYTQIWRNNMFPEYFVYENGKQKKSFVFSNDKTKGNIEKLLDKLVVN